MSDFDYQKCPSCNHDEHNVLSFSDCSQDNCDCKNPLSEAIEAANDGVERLKYAIEFLKIVIGDTTEQIKKLKTTE